MHPNAPHCTPTYPNAPRGQFSGAKDRPECTELHPGAPECTRKTRSGKTNPPTLSLAQHAAIRYLVRGYRVGQIAQHLGVSRHTIKRWKHDPRFVAEMEHLRRAMNAAIISPGAKATPPPRAMDPLEAWLNSTAAVDARDDENVDETDDETEEEEEISDEEFAETEAWVEQVIAAGRAGKEIPPPPPLKGPL
jgi:transposase-like protein